MKVLFAHVFHTQIIFKSFLEGVNKIYFSGLMLPKQATSHQFSVAMKVLFPSYFLTQIIFKTFLEGDTERYLSVANAKFSSLKLLIYEPVYLP